MTEPIHDKHLQARYAMADRLAYFLYSNHMGSDWMKHAGDRLWITVCHQSGEKVKRVGGKDVGPSLETRELTLSKLQDLEASGAKRGPSLAEIEDARGTSSWGVPASSTVSDGSPQDQGLPVTDPSDPSEVVATSPAFRGEGQAAPTTTSQEGASTENQPAVPARPTSRSESVAGNTCPPAGSRLSGTPRGGQVSLLPPHQVHSETSISAARSISHETAAMRLRVLQFLRDNPGCTDEEIAEGTGLPPNTARPRRVELMRSGTVVQVGKKVARSGRKANAWAVREAVAS